MRGDRFDDISRRAVTPSPSGTRRSFLRAIGLGGAAVGLAPALSDAAPVPSARSSTSAAQVVPVDEINDLAFSLDYDIERIFRFVRDEVVYDPY